MNGAPKQALKVACGSVMPRSVPATFAVYPEMKWYIACSGVNFETGGNTRSVYSPEWEKLTSIKVGKHPIDVEISADGRWAYVTAEQDNRVFVYQITQD